MPDDVDPFDTLSQTLEAERREGVVHVHRQERLPEMATTAELDTLARELGMRELGARWRPIEVDDAIEILTALLWLDMAYGAPIMEHERAQTLAREFVALFGEGVRCFTNGSWQADPGRGRMLSGWSALTKATFDSGVVVVGAEHLGLLWFEDED